MATIARNVLPLDPKPSHYELTITPDFDKFTFAGVVAISLESQEGTKNILLNSFELTYRKAVVKNAAGEEQTINGSDITIDEPNLRAAIPLQKEVKGQFTLTIEYDGEINDKMCGFYRSKYTVAGKEAYMGTTQFEAVDARRALPCWDEPVHKATFGVTLVVDNDLMALCNTPESGRKEVDGGKKVAVTFEKSPVMSSYLLAWTIGKLEMIEKTIDKAHGGKTTIRIFTPENKIKQGEFALDVAAKCLPLYEKFFGSNYILSKCDLLAIPDFAAGAMENWGLITYRETALLCDETSSASHRQRVAMVVAHELAHQWFGNLVTMEWWKELWLNEAFATWVQYWAVDTFFPEWEVFTQFVNTETGRALTLDALASSHPVEVDVVNAQEIDDIFDAISYSKGGSVLRMTIEYIGMKAFQEGISNYLKNFEYGNATTVDLWNYFGKAANTNDLAEILAPWTGAQGYPYLKVSQETETTIKIVQHRFLSTGPASEADDQTIWKIPLNFIAINADGTKTTFSKILSERENVVEVPKGATIRVNANQTAFCRVMYEESMLPSVQAAVKAKALGPIDRLSIVNDLAAFAQSGFISATQALGALTAFVDEDDTAVWSAIVGLEADVRGITPESARDNFNKFAAKVYKPTAERLGFVPKEGDSDLVKQTRALLLGRLVVARDADAIAACRKMMQSRDTTPIPSDLRFACYRMTVREDGVEGFNAVKAIFESSTDAMERVRCLQSLGAATTDDLVTEAISYAMGDSVRSQDSWYLLGAISANPKGAAPFLKLITTQFAALSTKFPGMLLGRILKGIENLSTLEEADEIEKFWATLLEADRQSSERSFQQGLEGLKNVARWAQRDAESIAAFVKDA